MSLIIFNIKLINTFFMNFMKKKFCDVQVKTSVLSFYF